MRTLFKTHSFSCARDKTLVKLPPFSLFRASYSTSGCHTELTPLIRLTFFWNQVRFLKLYRAFHIQNSRVEISNLPMLPHYVVSITTGVLLFLQAPYLAWWTYKTDISPMPQEFCFYFFNSYIIIIHYFFKFVKKFFDFNVYFFDWNNFLFFLTLI